MENKPEFNIGEMIKMKIDGSVGQIVGDMGLLVLSSCLLSVFPAKIILAGIFIVIMK